MPITFGSDSPIIAAGNLPSSSISLGWHNNQRKRLQKLAEQYINDAPAAVAELKSQGQPDTSLPEVQATRRGFTELRARLPVMHQYYVYTGSHSSTADAAYLSKMKQLILAWVRTNQPTGKPIDETNFENLLRVMKARWADFSSSEQSEMTAWLNALKTAKEAWDFTPLPNEGKLLYGNHFTHHYKILWQVYDLLGLTTLKNALKTTLQTFATQNFPFGNANILYPLTHTITGTSVSNSRFDIDGDYVSRFPTGHTFTVTGNTQGNNGTYTVVSASFLTSSTRTRIVVTPAPIANGGGGAVIERLQNTVHDMQRAATMAGESIDYIRRDAQHYQHYDLEPWLEIALFMGDNTFETLMDNGCAFLFDAILNPASKHYEFANTSDSFDALRWQTSRPQYLQPTSMYRPDDAARVIFAYDHFKRSLNPSFQVDDRLLSYACRSDQLPSFWYYYFRWVFNGLYG